MTKLSDLAKFRPVLSALQISHICKLARENPSNDSLGILASLAAFEYKIKQGAVTPAYTEQPRASLTSALGFDEPNQSSSEAVKANQNHKEHIETMRNKEALYQMWLDSHPLGVDELRAVQAYRYENSKMTTDEERAYEKDVLGLDI